MQDQHHLVQVDGLQEGSGFRVQGSGVRGRGLRVQSSAQKNLLTMVGAGMGGIYAHAYAYAHRHTRMRVRACVCGCVRVCMCLWAAPPPPYFTHGIVCWLPPLPPP